MRELVLNCREAQADALSDALLEAGVLSVSVEDADLGTEAEWPLFGEPGTEPQVQAWERNCVVALLPDGADPAQILEQAIAAAGLDPALAHGWSLREVPDADWVRLTQSQFGLIPISERLWIVPSWHRDDPAVPGLVPDAARDAIHIELDPGLAFGTGSHPTTHLCLAWLEAELPAGALAGLRLRLGHSGHCRAQAGRGRDRGGGHRSAGRAVHRRQCRGQPGTPAGHAARCAAGRRVPDRGGEHPLQSAQGAGAHAGRARCAGGHLVLSGVLERQADEVAAAYAPWLTMSVWRERDGWVCLHGVKA